MKCDTGKTAVQFAGDTSVVLGTVVGWGASLAGLLLHPRMVVVPVSVSFALGWVWAGGFGQLSWAGCGRGEGC